MGRKRGVQYRSGGFLRSDDRSGFTRRAEDTKAEWNELIVGKDLWEARQPQDFVRGVPDDQTVPSPRPVPPPVFTGPLSTTLAAPALIGDTFLALAATNGFSPGGNVGVILDNGSYFNTTQVGESLANGINIANAIVGAGAAQGNIVTAYESPGP